MKYQLSGQALDIGPKTAELYQNVIHDSKLVIGMVRWVFLKWLSLPKEQGLLLKA